MTSFSPPHDFILKWLDTLEKTDPEGYKRLIDTIQNQVKTAEMERTEDVVSARKGDIDAEMYNLLKASASERRTTADTNSLEFKSRFCGDKFIREDGSKDTQEGMYIDVKPGFVLMTNDTQNKKKVFVNIVFADEIQVFSEKTKLDDKGKEQKGIHVPLSLGAPREVENTMGVSSLAFDVAVNTKAVEDCKVDKTGTFRNFVCELAIEYIDLKYKIKLDGRYKLPRLTYRGKLPPPRHYIRKAQPPIIQEVTPEITAALKQACTSKSTAQKITKASSNFKMATARFDIFEERNGDRVVCQRLPSVMKGSIPLSPAVLELAGDRLIVSVKFGNNVRAARDVKLELHAELLSVKTTTHNDLEIFLPYPVDRNSARVCFDPARNTVDVILIIDKSWDTLGPDCGSASWLLEQELAKENEAVAKSNTKKPKTLVEMFQLANAESSNDRNRATRQLGPVIEDDKVPKNQSHRKDVMMSMHSLEQRRIEREQETKQPEAKWTQKCDEAEEMQETTQENEKSCSEMYPNELESTYINVEAIVRQEKSRLDRHQQQQKEEIDSEKEYMHTEKAKRIAAKWSRNNKDGSLNLQSALAFGLY
ncbi:unnamed protein product [Peronospora belbahrii]|uniref:PIH1 N-terminal domain-containing protein n=1 Tax=Peronospora belbahrii TaxID=622444 RepID=A0ABN8CRC3_9STRA|nr:unnamed protein product [Peronospora belbahrii]